MGSPEWTPFFCGNGRDRGGFNVIKGKGFPTPMGDASKCHNIRMVVAYDGTLYHGWQRQKNGISIQEAVEEKIGVMLEEDVKLIASGRTDAGVHAVGQSCHFETRTELGPDTVKKGLNALLPNDIWVKEAVRTPTSFHARYSARSKTYEYRILNREAPDIFLRHYVWHIRSPLDVDKMASCLQSLIGRHDFASFRSSGSDNKNPVRTMMRSEIKGLDEQGLLRVVMEADGFLRHMVRNIVGTVVAVGLGKMDPQAFQQIVASRDRTMAGIKAPARGLFLMNVTY